MNYYGTEETSFLSHHGILGQKWGVRRYQNADGTLTSAGKKRYNTEADTRNRYEKRADRLKEKSAAAAKAHLAAIDSGDERAKNKTEKKALRQLNKFLNAEDKAGGYNAFDANKSYKKYAKTTSQIRRLEKKNDSGQYDEKIKELSKKSSAYKQEADSKQWKSIGRYASAENIARKAAGSGYTVRRIRASRSFQSGKQRMAILLGVYASTRVPANYYHVRR